MVIFYMKITHPRGNFHAGWEFSDPRGVGIWLRLRQLCVPTTYLVRIINNIINNGIIFKWYDFQVSIRSDDTPPLRGGEKKVHGFHGFLLKTNGLLPTI